MTAVALMPVTCGSTPGTARPGAQLGGDIDGEAASDYSGWSVSLSSDGQTLAVGARLNDGTGDCCRSRAGL